MGDYREGRGGEASVFTCLGRKHLVGETTLSLWAVGSAARVSARPVGPAQLGPKGFLQARAPSPITMGLHPSLAVAL